MRNKQETRRTTAMTTVVSPTLSRYTAVRQSINQSINTHTHTYSQSSQWQFHDRLTFPAPVPPAIPSVMGGLVATGAVEVPFCFSSLMVVGCVCVGVGLFFVRDDDDGRNQTEQPFNFRALSNDALTELVVPRKSREKSHIFTFVHPCSS